MIEALKKDVLKGLSATNKFLPSKYFYDKKGDELFMKIMHLPEYYVTRAELEIFKFKTRDIIESLVLNKGTYFELIELGAGDGLKTKELLYFLDKENYKFDFLPIDISKNALDLLEKSINKELPNISIKKKQGDYFQVLDSLKETIHPKVVLFLGSNIGNMADAEAKEFIYKLGINLNKKDKLFLGVDLIKPKAIVLPAYNDSQGITREFNLNLLTRINKELGANFKINNFLHQPEYCIKEGVARSFLVSTIEQTVYIPKIKKAFFFKKGEKVSTEISRKYNDKIINTIIKNTSFVITKKLNDNKNYFANYVLNKM